MRRRTVMFAVFLTTIAAIVYSCQNPEQLKQDIYYTNGRDLYIRHCQNCHGTNGEGLNALIPPLTDTVFLKKHKRKIACYIKNGLSEKIIVNGITYQEKMPATQLANIDIAQLIVYITNSFGNKQGNYTSEQTATDLNNCK